MQVVEDGRAAWRGDSVATEEPLEIRVVAGGRRRPVAVTMRTPGADFELAVGFLFCEGLLSGRDDVRRVTYCTDGARGVEQRYNAEQRYNIVNVELRGEVLPDLRSLDRHFYTSSACGICGKAALDALEVRGVEPLPDGPSVHAEVLYGLPERLRRAQAVFETTGGLHAAALFSPDGDVVAVREDVGRHNAVDKLLGWALLHDRLPLGREVLVVSGRSSYEILEKAVADRVAVVCGISAPSSLAVDLAERFGVTLVGFLRGRRFNVYARPHRVVVGAPAPQAVP